jgi:two-component system sensor histidine kinase ChvG
MAQMLRQPDASMSERLAEISAPLEVHALAVALDERARELERKNRYVAEFAANVSHELKTPLTSIRGAAELLQDGWAEMAPDQRGRFLQNIDRAAERTERLVSRLLYLARLESPRVEEEADQVSVRGFLQEVSIKYQDVLEITVTGAPETTGEAFTMSRAALEAVVGNLIDNALRHRKTEPVSVRVEIPSAREDLVHLTVCDDGPGILPENVSRVFERFFTTERDAGGTGLGLSIVRATAERRGGGARISSHEGGTVAEVWF